MNKFVVCAMDKRKTVEELEDNCRDADAAAAYSAAYWSSAAAAYNPCDLEFWLSRYFDLTGEDREAYQEEADK